MIDVNSLTWTVENKPDLTTHRAQWRRWTFLVNEFPTQVPKDTPEGHRYQARVFSTRGKEVALELTWSASIDAAKQLCAVTANRAK